MEKQYPDTLTMIVIIHCHIPTISIEDLKKKTVNELRKIYDTLR